MSFKYPLYILSTKLSQTSWTEECASANPKKNFWSWNIKNYLYKNSSPEPKQTRKAPASNSNKFREPTKKRTGKRTIKEVRLMFHLFLAAFSSTLVSRSLAHFFMCSLNVAGNVPNVSFGKWMCEAKLLPFHHLQKQTRLFTTFFSGIFRERNIFLDFHGFTCLGFVEFCRFLLGFVDFLQVFLQFSPLLKSHTFLRRVKVQRS